ncbi:MAG TPA: COX15/CtaA family protein [Acidimicrobiia bacterium]|nr:COX15/CtaA family protein [Acidimicrobiia bacterium]
MPTLPYTARVQGLRFTPRGFRRLALVNVVVLVAIIVSGAAVRLTNSGLGCADWPQCSATRVLDVSTHHAAIEQLNRVFSGAIGIPIAIALIGAYRRIPRDRDLVRLAWILFVLFWGEAVLGGISVKVKLAWVSVMGHFLLAIALVGIALAMYRRAREAPRRPSTTVPRIVAQLGAVVYALTIVVVVLGTLVTAAGPHGGDRDATRLGWPLVDVARVHGATVDTLLAVVLCLLVLSIRRRAPETVVRATERALVIMAAQGALGYIQYFREIPALLVGFHVFGAVLVFIAAQQLVFTINDAKLAAVDSHDDARRSLSDSVLTGSSARVSSATAPGAH